MRLLALLAAALLTGAAAAPSAAGSTPPEWTRPTAPFRVVGPIYYVGTEGIGVYLISTDDGLILLDGGLEQNAAIVDESIRKLGFDPHDVKILIATHAHWDHAAALAQLKRDTGAAFLSSEPDRQAYETGTPPGENLTGGVPFAPIPVDDVLVDGRPVRLGDVAITPMLTPGHTPGCTSWTMDVAEHGKPLNVAFLCSMSVAGNRLVANKAYPGIVADYRKTFIRLRAIHPDVVLTAHAELADVPGRARARDAGNADAFLARDLLPGLVDDAEAAFETELARQKDAQ